MVAARTRTVTASAAWSRGIRYVRPNRRTPRAQAPTAVPARLSRRLPVATRIRPAVLVGPVAEPGEEPGAPDEPGRRVDEKDPRPIHTREQLSGDESAERAADRHARLQNASGDGATPERDPNGQSPRRCREQPR